MRVDGHAHLIQEDLFGEPYWDGVARIGASMLGVPGEALRESVIPAYFDHDGTAQHGAQEQAGIDVAVILVTDWSLEEHLGPAGVTWRQHNDRHAAIVDRSEGRLRWGFGVDPRHLGAVEAFTEAVRDRGAVCLKLHPAGGWGLDDRVAYPLYERAGELDVPVVVHTGASPVPLYSKWSTAERLDAVAADFPDLRIQAAHTGGGSWQGFVAVASVKPNVYCDLSGWQVRFLRDPGRFHQDVRGVLDAVGHARVMWGSDAPYYRVLIPDGEAVRAFTEAPEGTYTSEEVDAILGGTARSFYRLEAAGSPPVG